MYLEWNRELRQGKNSYIMTQTSHMAIPRNFPATRHSSQVDTGLCHERICSSWIRLRVNLMVDVDPNNDPKNAWWSYVWEIKVCLEKRHTCHFNIRTLDYIINDVYIYKIYSNTPNGLVLFFRYKTGGIHIYIYRYTYRYHIIIIYHHHTIMYM